MAATTHQHPEFASESTDESHADPAAVRQCYQAVRTLVPEAGVVTLADLTMTTRLDAGTIRPAMARLGDVAGLEVRANATFGDERAWEVRR